jgi:hypothetical protein
MFCSLESKVVYALVSLHGLTVNFCSRNITRTKKEKKQYVDFSKQVKHYVYVEFSRHQERKQDKEK